MQANPYIEEIIEIPEEAQPDVNKQKLSYEKASGTVPFLDLKHYLKNADGRDFERKVGTGNYFM